MTEPIKWTDELWDKAQHMRRLGKSYRAIADVVGCTHMSVISRFKKMREEGPRYSMREGQNRPAIDPRVIADRDYRMALEHRDLTSEFFGDPKPGYSALDRFQRLGDVASRALDNIEAQRRGNAEET